MNFASVYFITANAERSSICKVGITIVKNSQILSSNEYKVRPIPFYFDGYNVDKYSLIKFEYKNCKNFPDIWKEIEPSIKDLTKVTHFISFQKSVFIQSFEAYNFTAPKLKMFCTLNISKFFNPNFFNHAIKRVCKNLHIELDMSSASGYSNAVALIAIYYAQQNNVDSLEELNDLIPKKNCGFIPGKESIFKDENLEFDSSEEIKGFSFCFTGEMEYCSRKDAIRIVEDSGGIINSSVTKTTDYLVIGANEYIKDGKPSSKVQKAQKLIQEGGKIQILTEEDFRQRLIIKSL